jgi:hypothetical protein
LRADLEGPRSLQSDRTLLLRRSASRIENCDRAYSLSGATLGASRVAWCSNGRGDSFAAIHLQQPGFAAAKFAKCRAVRRLV